MKHLRVRTFSHKTFQVYHVYCNFILCYMCRITVIFGTLKDGSLLIDIFASNNCFSYRNIFDKKADIFILFGVSDNDHILLACGINTYYGITIGISNFRCQHYFEKVARNILLEHQLLTRLLRLSSFMFPLLLLTV